MARPVELTKANRFEGKLRAWLRGEQLAIWDLFIQFPDGLDLALVEKVFTKFLAGRGADSHAIGVAGRRLNPQYLDLFLKVVATLPPSPARFAALATPQSGSPMERSMNLTELLDKTRKLGVFSMSRSQAAARAREFALDPHFVAAAQTIVQHASFTHREHWRWTMIETLLNDASSASLDALLPLVTRALAEKSDDLETLVDVVTRLKNPKPELTPLRALLGIAEGPVPRKRRTRT